MFITAGRDRIPPVELADAAEMWARSRLGSHAKLGWSDVMSCWVIEIERHPDDPILREWQAGRLRVKPVELAVLHEPSGSGHMRALPIEQWSADSLMTWLDQHTFGRGHDLLDYVNRVERKNEKNRQQQAKKLGEVGQQFAEKNYRQAAGVAFSAGGIEKEPDPTL